MKELAQVRDAVISALRGAGLTALASPMELDGEPLRPAVIRRGRSSGSVHQLSITIRQGKNRQVRRMCAQAGLTVLRLKRIREGSLSLDRRLRPGAWRPLTDGETAALLAEKNLQELV